MQRRGVEVTVGLFVVVGILALAYLSIKLGQVEIFGPRGYEVHALFPSVGGLKPGATVEIAGVPIGRVGSIILADYQARVTMFIDTKVELSDDSIVSIKTKGLIGEKFVQINPGGSDRIVPPGGRLREVEAPLDFEELISKFVFGQVEGGGQK